MKRPMGYWLPLWLQKKIRAFSFWLDYTTENWVIPDSTELCRLIENTPTPDYEAYNKRLAELEKVWPYDPVIERMKTHGRFKKFIRDSGLAKEIAKEIAEKRT